METAPWDVDGVRERVGKRVAEFLDDRRLVLDGISDDVGALVDPLSEFLAGGKRLRAVFLYWGWRCGGAQDCEAVISAASAMEFLQACALIHDDVMDRSETRRGRPAIHRQFESLHSSAGWAGAASDFGTATAILLGDLCLSWADELLLTSGVPDERLRRGKPVYDLMRTELMAGQYLDMLEQVRRNDQVEAALRVATFKSAKYTIERPLHLGAVMGGAHSDQVAAL
ncbi:MAG: polyprenyl synthetase family protein, partial [Candidatus Nanopelagicales bacterium]